MARDPWDDPEMQKYLDHARRELQPMIEGSAFCMSIAPSSDPDPKICMETGYMMWLDKPIIVLAEPGQAIPRNIRKVAFRVIYGNPADPAVRGQIHRAINDLGLGDAKS
jgi:hypothetical protein